MFTTLRLKVSTSLFALVLFTCASVAQQPKDISAIIKVTINGSAVDGEREVLEATELRGTKQARRIVDSSVIAVTRNESFQLVVEALYKDGSTDTLTKSRRLQYESDGCITVSPEGFVNITPMATCSGQADAPRLTVVLLDSEGHVEGWNRYQFEVR
jgi:hypothetical protein